MIDYGLLGSVVVALGVPALLARRWPLEGFDPPVGFIDAVLGPALGGLAAGRLVAVALDDPRSLGRLADMLVVRSGVEFWPGAAVAVMVAAWSARRVGVPVPERLAALAPLAMVGYGAYEASCVLRDGCYGPVSPVGLRPSGLSSTMLPVGVLMAAAVIVAAGALRNLGARHNSALTTVLASLAVVATVRATASFWLPKIGDALTRQHRTSLAVAATTILALVVLALSRTRHPTSMDVP